MNNPARDGQRWSKQETADLLKLHKQLGNDYTAISLAMKDRSAKSIKSKMERILKPEKKKVLKNTGTKRERKRKRKNLVSILLRIIS